MLKSAGGDGFSSTARLIVSQGCEDKRDYDGDDVNDGYQNNPTGW